MTPKAGALLAALATLLLALAVVACGGEDDEQEGAAARGNATEQAFLEAMIPHHEAAIEMAAVARRRGGHEELKRLAGSIARTQAEEIAAMRRIHKRLFGSEITPDPDAHGQLGLSAEAAGMVHADGGAPLASARPFDRAFIDEMVPHHQGAIRMAHVLAAKTDDPELDRLADSIIEAQSAEIEDMNDWRAAWYGDASPAGGAPVPGSDEALPADEHEGEDHSG